MADMFQDGHHLKVLLHVFCYLYHISYFLVSILMFLRSRNSFLPTKIFPGGHFSRWPPIFDFFMDFFTWTVIYRVWCRFMGFCGREIQFCLLKCIVATILQDGCYLYVSKWRINERENVHGLASTLHFVIQAWFLVNILTRPSSSK